jgi:hypothetical protein
MTLDEIYQRGIIQISPMTHSQNEAIRKLNEIQKLLDDGKGQKAEHFILDALTWLICDRIDEVKAQSDGHGTN